ncbi:transcriptional regulator GcvA [Lacibacterium aquatile]|uniref:Transcriptional regulator GcvA n=1 Tax=Lacibacterium aquatile TaxID=1168082 RepID=A0ABW5DLE6_9PROT
MRPRLPPLNALRAFEAAAATLSFTKAAEDLFVTQGAVSRQVKLLEEYLGLPLFRRLHRGLELTEEGRRLLSACSDAFDRLAHAAEGLKASQNELRLKVPPTFAIRWLIRRLDAFEAANPTVRVRLSTAFPDHDFQPHEFDAAILYRPQNTGALRQDLVMTELLTPVASPEVAARLKSPKDLARTILLHPTADMRDWRDWLKLAGLPALAHFRDQIFDTEDFSIQAAASGRGVAIANLPLIEEDLSAGRLIAPFPDLKLATGNDYFLAYPAERANLPKIAAFRDWLRGASAR